MNPTKSINESGTIFYKNDKGQLHREDGPAVESTDGYKAWYLNGQRHREDGPAIEYPDGDKWWYINGTEYSEDQYNEEIFKRRLERFKNL